MVQLWCDLYLNYTLTTGVWEEPVGHLRAHSVAKSCNKKTEQPYPEIKVSLQGWCMKISLSAKAVRRPRVSVLVQSTVPALAVRAVSRWHRNRFHPSQVSPLSWRELTYDLLRHALCRSLRRFQLGHTHTRRLKKAEEAKAHSTSQTTSKFWAATSNLRARHGPGTTSTENHHLVTLAVAASYWTTFLLVDGLKLKCSFTRSEGVKSAGPADRAWWDEQALKWG